MFAVLHHPSKAGQKLYVRPLNRVDELLAIAQHGDTMHRVRPELVVDPGDHAAAPLVQEVRRQLNEGQFVRV